MKFIFSPTSIIFLVVAIIHSGSIASAVLGGSSTSYIVCGTKSTATFCKLQIKQNAKNGPFGSLFKVIKEENNSSKFTVVVELKCGKVQGGLGKRKACLDCTAAADTCLDITSTEASVLFAKGVRQ
jgi:hypothetical protein